MVKHHSDFVESWNGSLGPFGVDSSQMSSVDAMIDSWINKQLPHESVDHISNDLSHILGEGQNRLNPGLPVEIEYSDNLSQLKVIEHHYLNEFGKGVMDKSHISSKTKSTTDLDLQEVVNDYSQDTTIYQVINGIPTTYHGQQGVRNMCRDLLSKVENLEFEHVAVNHDHAQVVWKGETKLHAKIIGTDSFTFDKENHIKSQTIVALTEE